MINKILYIHTMEYYAAVIKNDVESTLKVYVYWHEKI